MIFNMVIEYVIQKWVVVVCVCGVGGVGGIRTGGPGDFNLGPIRYLLH